jgi:hypothetical protein
VPISTTSRIEALFAICTDRGTLYTMGDDRRGGRGTGVRGQLTGGGIATTWRAGDARTYVQIVPKPEKVPPSRFARFIHTQRRERRRKECRPESRLCRRRPSSSDRRWRRDDCDREHWVIVGMSDRGERRGTARRRRRRPWFEDCAKDE